MENDVDSKSKRCATVKGNRQEDGQQGGRRFNPGDRGYRDLSRWVCWTEAELFFF